MTTPRKYGDPTGDPQLGPESARDLEAITDHIETWWGQIARTYHEIKSEYVHIDVHWIKPVPDHPYHTLITSGMSDRPMSSQKGSEGGYYAELLVTLPPEWPIDEESFKDERNYWPIRQLKQAARFPHIHETWLWYSHTISNESPAQKYADDVSFCAGILSLPFLCDEEARKLKINDDKVVHFFSFVPIYESELQLARQEGSDRLFELLDEVDTSELIDKHRRNVCD